MVYKWIILFNLLVEKRHLNRSVDVKLLRLILTC